MVFFHSYVTYVTNYQRVTLCDMKHTKLMRVVLLRFPEKKRPQVEKEHVPSSKLP